MVDKLLITSKTKPALHLVVRILLFLAKIVFTINLSQFQRSARPITSLATIQEFESLLLPSMKRFLLRNPEVIMTCKFASLRQFCLQYLESEFFFSGVAELCNQLSIDLSTYALDLVKPMACKKFCFLLCSYFISYPPGYSFSSASLKRARSKRTGRRSH